MFHTIHYFSSITERNNKYRMKYIFGRVFMLEKNRYSESRGMLRINVSDFL